MNQVAIVTDSAANLPSELVARYGIHVVPIKLYWNGQTFLDGVDLSAGELYRRLRTDASELPQSSSPSIGDFVRTFARLSQEHEAILSIHLAAGLSATYAAAQQARAILEDATIKVVDSRSASMGCGFAVLSAARAAAQGADLSEAMQAAQAVIERVRVYGVLDSLRYVQRSGRVPAIAAIASSVLQIHPLLYIRDGQAGLLNIQRTKQRAVRALLDVVEREAGERPIHAAVLHADAPVEAENLRRQIAERCNCRELLTTEFTPVMGSYAGPGLVGVAFYPAVD